MRIGDFGLFFGCFLANHSCFLRFGGLQLLLTQTGVGAPAAAASSSSLREARRCPRDATMLRGPEPIREPDSYGFMIGAGDAAGFGEKVGSD